MEIIEKVGYKDPTPIQRQAIPIGFQVTICLSKNLQIHNTYNILFIFFRIVTLLVLQKPVLEKLWLTLYHLLNGSNLYLKWNVWKMLIK